MKAIVLILITLLAIAAAQEQARVDVGNGVALVPVEKVRAPVPLFFSATAGTTTKVGLDAAEGRFDLAFKILQGKPETLSLSLHGKGEVTGVTGDNLKDWSVRTEADGSRFLDLHPDTGKVTDTWTVQVTTRSDLRGSRNEAAILLPGLGKASGFSLAATLEPAADVDLRVLKAEGLVPVEGGNNRKFQGSALPLLTLAISRGGTAPRELELVNATLAGTGTAQGDHVSFTLTAEARSTKAGATCILLLGNAALAGDASGDGWHVRLKREGDNYVHELVADRAGSFPASIAFQAPLKRKGDWRVADFTLPSGVVVPLRLEGLGDKVSFDRTLPVAPERDGTNWRGFLPANGRVNLAWKGSREEAEGALFFSSTEVTEIRVGSGLLRELSSLRFRVLQGKLNAITLKLDGPGEILSVQGEQVLGWTVREEGGARRLEVTLNRPIEGEGELRIEAQAALGSFPVKTTPLRFTPQGTLRHSGWVRVASQGAVRLEVQNTSGMMQLAPGQFPIGGGENLRQASVYRFPSADRSFDISADQVLPEVGVNEVTLYEIAETDRRILADLELDIREAPLREWELAVPEDFAVAGVTGAAVADFNVAGAATGGKRIVKVLFNQPVDGRQLVSLRLEKNEAAKAGTWDLPVLDFPGAKSRRGFVGVISAPGFRVTPAKSTALAEVPLTFFPKQAQGLQQAFRLRDAAWSASMKIEALGQNVQADVFHLYSLKAGAAYGSVLMNYFVVGAPATEWRIAVPAGIGNIDITGQSVGKDWRREGDVVVVPLSRPVLGAGTVLLTFEQPMSARGGVISPGAVRPLNVQSERGYVQVVSPLQVNHTVAKSEGPLLKLEANELPPEYRLLTSAPTLGAWQYTARDFTIDLDVKWFATGETAEQVVDFLKLSSQISRDGQIVTDARFFVKSRGRAALRLKLPEGSRLWETRVDGTAANAREDGADTLVPLPAKNDPNDPVEVVLRYGAQAKRASSPTLAAPVLDAPVVIGEWLVGGDANRRLLPDGGNAELVRPVREPNGFQRVAIYARKPAAFIGVLAIASLIIGVKSGSRWRAFTSLIAGLALSAACVGAAMMVWRHTTFNPPPLEYAAPVVAPGQQVSIEVANIAPWRANVSWLGVIAVLGGLGLMVHGAVKHSRLSIGGGAALIGLGLLAQIGGAPWFFVLLAIVALVLRVIPVLPRLRMPRAAPAAAALLAGLLWFAPAPVRAAEAQAAESIVQQWKITDGRLQGEIDLTVRGEAGDRFLLLRPPAVLSNFQGTGLRVIKAPVDNKDTYFVVMDAAGKGTGRASFEMPLAKPQDGWQLPTGTAATQRVTVRWTEPGWEFVSASAASTTPLAGVGEKESGATLVLAPQADAVIQARPRQRDVGAETTRYFSEVSNLFLPGPGVVNGRHRVTIRPTQGRVTSLVLRVPEAFTVGDVTDGPVGGWRFDPRTRELRVAIEPAQQAAFAFTVESQRGTEALPLELALSPLRVTDSAGEVGLLALGFGDDAQPETVTPKGLSVVNLEDFDQRLVPADPKGRPLALVQRVFRYGAEEAGLTVRVAPVAPELRVESRQVLSLGEDRMVLAVDLAVTITRTGVFRVVLEVPEGLEIEAVTGDALSHWTESKDGGKRLVTLHLNGRTLGRQNFSLSLASPPPGAQASWNIPRVITREAARETGTLIVVPERGLQVRAVVRDKVSQLDPRELGDNPQARDAMRPGALAFRLLQSDWKLAMAVERLDPWVTAQVLHEVTLREGQMLHHLSLRYKIENAAVKSLRVTIPGLDAAAVGTVRATGPGVGDLVPVAGTPGTWEIRFQRGVAGDAAIELEYQSQSKGGGSESVAPVILEQVRQLSYFVAIRAGGRLELKAPSAPRGWERTDWAVVRNALPQAAGAAAPGLSYRVAEAEGPLPVVVERHDLAGSLKLRVASGQLTTLLSPRGDALTAVDLKMEVVEKGTLRLRLPEKASLFNVLVNDEGAPLVREGNHWLFYVFPAPEGGRPASVRFVYSAGSGTDLKLQGPALEVPTENSTWRDVPLENLTWRVLVPDGWKLAGHDGDFDLKDEASAGVFRLEDYQSFVRRKRASDAKDAVALLDQANDWLARGEQDKAGQALSKAARANTLDAASNEDARVQLRQLKTQQAVLGLNTRRQRLYLDNKAEVSQLQNAQIEQAASDNPVLQGNYNYNPQQFDQYVAGNTADENSALKAIANRIVTQQLAAEPAPVALDVTLPQRGTVLTFGRSVQVDGGKTMTLNLDLKKKRTGSYWLGGLMCLVLGGLVCRRK
ncbi:hypothetical protein KBB96_18420 [Luteolibacter ambystomatis]|uniref:Uncharacterized protein n=1 Tax=Luteolibacter ambystomatis TaxID=2824561 RepID=A0A975IYV8_9BACT|nr:hypothetical protein [Luteolibacter ambystomatis]QUE50821.1 hypothetical protein KBB96_18420 [Luteolibacter ambystomatis]